MSYDLIAVGLNAVDVLVRLPESVVQDDKQFVEDLVIQGGAPVGSGCCGVARLGYRVGMVARLGSNTLSAICLEEFRSNGVDTALIVRDETSRPAIALVEIDPRTAARTVFIQMDNYGYLRTSDIPGAEIARAKAILVDSYDLDATEAALEAAAGTPCRSILDFESGDQDRLKKLLGMGTDPILPLAAARGLTGMSEPGDVLRALGDLCPGQVLVTDGIQGSWALDREAGGIIHQPAFVVDAVDTTGCGDAFHAGYIVGVLEGWSLALRMEFGSLLASRVAGRVGGRTALPSQKNDLIRSDISSNLHQHLIL